jgi:dTMP kinase
MDQSNIDRVFAKNRRDRGTLIAIVGFNGSGKTTQVAAIAERLRSAGREVVETRQPTDWYRNDSAVVEYQANGGSRQQARMLSLFGAADRLRHVDQIINPALQRGATVICERYVYAHFSSFIHRGVDADFIAIINSGIPKPDFAFYLDVPPTVLFERLTQRNRGPLRFEERSIDQVRSIVKNYDEMSDHLIRLDGLAVPHVITSTIVSQILSGDKAR